jgi:hypothetical protein
MRLAAVVLVAIVVLLWLIAERGRTGRVVEGAFAVLEAVMVALVLVPLAALAVLGWLAVRYGVRHAPGALRWLATHVRRAACLTWLGSRSRRLRKAKASTTEEVTS